MISKPDIIRLAACHECCAPRGTPCTFIRADDPHGRRMAARQSHLDRIQRARAVYEKMQPPTPEPIDTFRLTL